MRAIHAVSFLLCLTGAASWAQGIDIKKRAPLGREEAARKETGLRRSIKAGDYQRAWNACAELLLSREIWGEQCRDAVLLARIALADPRVSETGRERLEIGIDLLRQFQERMKGPEYGQDARAVSAFNRSFAQIAYQNGVLGIACGETRMATQLFGAGADLALNADFTALRDKRDRETYKPLLKGMVRYLVVFRKTDKAVELIERHWELLGDDAWKVEGAPKTKEFVRGCSLLQVANMVDEMGNLPTAARLLLRAYNAFGFDARKQSADPKEEQVLRQAYRAVMKVKSGEYSLWTSQPFAKYEDPKPLRKTFQALLDQLADAWVRQDVEAALKLLKDPEKAADRVAAVFRKEPRPRSLQWTVGGLGPVKAGATSVCPVCRVEAVLSNGQKRTGDSPFKFVRDGATWKIASFAKGDDE